MKFLRFFRRSAGAIAIGLILVSLSGSSDAAFAQIISGPGRQHYKAWRVMPMQFLMKVKVQDQFMQDSLQLTMIEYLANPVRKIHPPDTSTILNPNNHLTWYRAMGRDTLVSLSYANQFESTAVSIGHVEFLLVPTLKVPHAPPESLDHYKVYRINEDHGFRLPIWLQDQFDAVYGMQDFVDSLKAVYFLTPAIKNNERPAPYDSATHYVAYEIVPPRMFTQLRTTMDQFGMHELQTQLSQYLLVPSRKYLDQPLLGSICGTKFNDLNCNGARDPGEPGLPGWTINLAGPLPQATVTNAAGAYCFTNLPPGQYTVSEVLQAGWTQTLPPAPGTYAVQLLPGQTMLGVDFGNCQPPQGSGPQHYKAWTVLPQAFAATVKVKDQFMVDSLRLNMIEFLSNPVRKVHGQDTFGISNPNNHLTWYRALGRDTLVNLWYANQFESTAVSVGHVDYLLVPTQKLPHGLPETLDHYKAYLINNPGGFRPPVSLRDQFDELLGMPHYVDSLRAVYFLTPAIKNSETPVMFDSATHYVAYEIVPPRIMSQMRSTIDQFGPHELMVQRTQYLLVPSRKYIEEPLLGSICGNKFNDLDRDGVWDQGEPGMAGWTINLTGPLPLSTVTNAGGGYCFSNLPQGAYTVSEVLQPGWTRTKPPPPGTYAVQLAPGQSVQGIDFGNSVQAPPQPGEGRNHYKTWHIGPQPANFRVRVQDQFMVDTLHLVSINSLSNPVKKIYGADTSAIVNPYHHLSWYAAAGRDTSVLLTYVNQFESTAVFIHDVGYLLVPTQTPPQPVPDSLDHYKAYAITEAESWFRAPVWLRDEIDSLFGQPEIVDSLRAAFVLTPAIKNNERPGLYDSVTHYVAYEISPTTFRPTSVPTVDQFGPHVLPVLQSEYLMVPSRKIVPGCTTSVVDSIRGGWNLVALSLAWINPTVSRLYPNAVSSAFEYVPGAGYAGRDALEIGKGYWLKFPAPEVITFLGCPVTCDTVAVAAGWNLVGAITRPVSVSAVTSIPPGIILTGFFGYSSSGYTPVTTLEPFHGYWVKVNQAGSLVLCSGGAPGETWGAGSAASGAASSVSVSDATGVVQALLFAPENGLTEDPDRYELPPLPPAGVFDARFSTGRFLEAVAPGEERTVPVAVTSVRPPLRVSWDLRDGDVSAALITGGREIRMTGRGHATLAGTGGSIALRIGASGSLPREFALIQNYPNPFNPLTTIKYQLPSASDVVLKVYDLLGREVATLVNAEEKPGTKSVQWDARGVASGVYFYRLQAGSCTSTRSMVLIR